VRNTRPVISEPNVCSTPPEEQSKKGALFLNTVRSVIGNDAKWFKLLHDYYQHFKYQTIMTTDMIGFFNKETGLDLTAIFDEYLRHAAPPTLELKFDEGGGAVSYRWKADDPNFAMPILVGQKDHWEKIQPVTIDWKTIRTPLKKDDFEVATDLYYVIVSKSQ